MQKEHLKNRSVFRSNFTSPLNNIKVASPCQADWNAMIGDERKRFCGSCKLNVYNLSGMTRTEAEKLLIQSEGRLCVRFYQRADGTVLTKDCPVGWRALKKRISKTAAAFVSLLFGLLAGLGLTTYFNRSEDQVIMGDISIENSNHTMGTVAVSPTPQPFMGNVSIEPNRANGKYVLGEPVRQVRTK